MTRCNCGSHAVNVDPERRECDTCLARRLLAIVDRLDPPPDQCEHGVKDGDWCEPCNREYKRAAIENAAEERARLPK